MGEEKLKKRKHAEITSLSSSVEKKQKKDKKLKKKSKKQKTRNDHGVDNEKEKKQKEKKQKKQKKENKGKKDKKEKKEKNDTTVDKDSPKTTKGLKKELKSSGSDVPEFEILEHPEKDEYLIKEGIKILAEKCPKYTRTFSGLGFPESLMDALDNQKFTKTTPIQAVCLPFGIQRRDLIGIAETGSGKTLAFLLPAIRRIMLSKASLGSSNIEMLVLAPTRELAIQIQQVSEKVCIGSGFRSLCIYGGVPKFEQIKQIKSGKVKIVVATPGRLLDLMTEGNVKLNNLKSLVFDEADRMLDMGFEPQIREIMKGVPDDNRHTSMFSATWPEDVQQMAAKFLSDPIHINIGSVDLSANKRIKQVVQVCQRFEKITKLKKLLPQLTKNGSEKVILFVLYKKFTQTLADALERDGWPVVCLSGNLSQQQREKSLAEFTAGTKQLLIATDVASRGIDFKGIKWVVNVEFPLTCEDYIHRIGRTGRAGTTGTAYTFFDPKENKELVHELVKILKDAGQEVDPELAKLASQSFARPKKTSMFKTYGAFSASTAKSTHITFD